MRNGMAIAARVILLAALAAPIDGCNIDAAPGRVAIDAARYRLPEVRYQVDAARNRVWLLTRDGVFLYDSLKPERIAVALPTWVPAGTTPDCLPDLALGPKGEAVITSEGLPTLWRVDPDTLAVSAHPLALDDDTNKEIGFSGLVYSARQRAYFATTFQHGSLWRIDPGFTRAQKISLSERLPEACGITLDQRGSHLASSGRSDLCILTRHGGGSIAFAPDGRSAYVRAESCADLVTAGHSASLLSR